MQRAPPGRRISISETVPWRVSGIGLRLGRAEWAGRREARGTYESPFTACPHVRLDRAERRFDLRLDLSARCRENTTRQKVGTALSADWMRPSALQMSLAAGAGECQWRVSRRGR